MNVKDAYAVWSLQYDSNDNKTRDLEAISLKEMLSNISFATCLEMGCGTGKNTVWLAQQANTIVAVDLTEQMIQKAKEKVPHHKVQFVIADITQDWNFATIQFDLATFSLVLEHIEHLHPLFKKLAHVIKPNGYVYIGELHPFKQYAGSKARFNTEQGEQVVDCYNHHISDFMDAAFTNGFELVLLKEYFDDKNRDTIPRILSILFKKK